MYLQRSKLLLEMRKGLYIQRKKCVYCDVIFFPLGMKGTKKGTGNAHQQNSLPYAVKPHAPQGLTKESKSAHSNNNRRKQTNIKLTMN